jgi:hypothetical protein
MPSRLRSETSRRNGAKSRGAKTPGGKSNSSGNALIHGIHAKAIVIEGENADRFKALLAGLRAELQPRTGIEEGLVEDLASSRWRQRRLLAMETACFTHAIVRQGPEAAAESGATRAVLALNNLAGDTRTMELINRNERRLDRQYNRTLRTLYALRILRKNDYCDSNPGTC